MSAESSPQAAPVEPVSTDPVDRVIRYHVQTKHHFNRYARALGYLDWANQPDPFRRFEGAELIRLPLLKPDEEPIAHRTRRSTSRTGFVSAGERPDPFPIL